MGRPAWSAPGRAVGSLRLGDHVCCWYHDDDARTRAVAAYVAAGLRHDDRIVYFTDTVPVTDVLAGLRRFGAMCLYDERTLTPERKRALTAAHPASVDGSAAEHWTPMLRMTREPAGMTLVGSRVDVADRAAVAALLEHVCAQIPPAEAVTVDVTGLRFIDAVTARLLARAAAARPGGVRVVGASPLLTRLVEAGTAA